jgi:hypothetical protein
MIITSSKLNFATTYQQQENTTRQQQIATSQQSRVQPGTPGAPATIRSRTDLAVEQRTALESSRQNSLYSRSSIRDAAGITSQRQTANSMQSLLTRFYNRNVRISSTMELQRPASADGRSLRGQQVSSMAVSQYYEYRQQQQLGFAVSGEVTTQEGKTVQFELYATASQDFRYRSGSGALAQQVVQRSDPLVINFGGAFNNLSDTVFEFDLDADGQTEELSFAGSGSGFLVFDRNQDGRINNGHEMFGARTGDGFGELAEFDEDGNGFIDANDSAYQSLQVYTRDAQGNEALHSLADLNIGAIGLESGLSPFQITDDLNQELGMAQRTGIFISGDGDVGTIQQIDLTRRDSDSEAALQQAFSAPSDAPPAPTASEVDPETADAPPSRFADILDAIDKLNAATRQLLEQPEEEDLLNTPKTLLGQLVESLEQYREQRDGRNEKAGA